MVVGMTVVCEIANYFLNILVNESNPNKVHDAINSSVFGLLKEHKIIYAIKPIAPKTLLLETGSPFIKIPFKNSFIAYYLL